MKKEYKDEFIQFLGNVLKLKTQGHTLPLFGKLVSLSPEYLTFERRDGRRTLVKRQEILTIEPVREQ
jgi:hypothetical protein